MPATTEPPVETPDTAPAPQPDPAPTPTDWEGSNPFASPSADFERALEDAPEPGSTIPPPPEPPPEEPKPAATQQPRRSIPEPSRKMLAADLTNAQAEVERLRSENETHLKKLGELESKSKELETQVHERDETFVKRRVPEYDWKKDKDVAPLRKEIGQIIEETSAELTRENRSKFEGQLPHIMKAYDVRLREGELPAFKDKLQEEFGEEAPQVFQAVKAIFNKERVAVEKESHNRENWAELSRREYADRRRQISDEVARIGKWSEEEIAANPDHPDAILTQVFRSNPKAFEAAQPILRQMVTIQAGLAPLNPDATPDEIAKARTFQGRVDQLRELGPLNAGRLQLVTSVMKSLYAEASKLRTRIERMSHGNAPESRSKTEDPAPADAKLADGEEYDTARNPFLRGA